MILNYSELIHNSNLKRNSNCKIFLVLEIIQINSQANFYLNKSRLLIRVIRFIVMKAK